MQKTAVVAVHYALWVPKYKVYQKRVSRHPVGGGAWGQVHGDERCRGWHTHGDEGGMCVGKMVAGGG